MSLAAILVAGNCLANEDGPVFQLSPEKWRREPAGITIERSSEYVTEGKDSIKVIFPRLACATITHFGLPVKDWSNYSSFQFDVCNPSEEEIRLMARFEDEKGKHFAMRLGVGTGSIIREQVPIAMLSKSVDVTALTCFKFYIVPPFPEKEGVTLYFDNIRLIGNIFEYRKEKLGRKLTYLDDMLSSIKASSPEVTTLKEKRAELEKEIDAVTAQSDMAPVEKKVAELSQEVILEKSFDTYGRNVEYAIGIESSLKKVFQDLSKFEGKVINLANISLAKNEYEAVQIVIIPLKKDLKNVRVEVSDLVGENRKENISKENIRINVVGYVENKHPSVIPVGTKYIGLWPDPLLDNRAFQVGKGKLQPIWVTVYAPKDTSAGLSEGIVQIKPENSHSFKVKLKVNVWDFGLPTVSSLKTTFQIWRPSIERYYDVSAFSEEGFEIMKKYYINFSEHRVSPMFIEGPPEKLVVKQSADGKKEYDFYWYDRYFDLFEKLNFNNYAVGNGPELFRKGAGYIKALAEYCEEKKIINKVYIYLYDEPNTPEQYEELRKIGDMITKTDKRFKTMLTTNPKPEFFDYVDIWCPGYYDSSMEKRRLLGEELWWYPGNGLFILDQPGLINRTIFWRTWQYKLDGFLHWSTTYWGKDPWQDPMEYADGNGLLIYPGKDGPINSIRWELIRDGLEDYEYFHLLRNKIKELKTISKEKTLIRESEKLLKIGLDENKVFIMTPYDSVPEIDPEKLYAIRNEVALYIEKINNIVAGKK